MYKIVIRKPRRRRRITQKQLARKSGISESYLSHLEKDNIVRDRSPSLQVIESLAISLSICPSDLIIYPCIECVMNNTCNHKNKDMRDPSLIIDEILRYYF